MFVITTRNFLPDIGGMQILMSDIANNLSKYKRVKVYADFSENSNDFDKNQKYEVIRIKGFKFIRKFRKANQIQDFLLKNKNIDGLISDHWKSLEKISKNTCSSTCTVCLIHGKEINHPNGSPLNTRMLNSLTKSKYVIANSVFTKNLAIEKGVDENKLVVINPGTDIVENENLDENQAQKLFNGASPKIISVCRLEKRKGLDKTILALKNFQSKYQNFKLIIIGDGDEKENLKSQIKNLNLSKNIILMKNINLKMKNSLIKLADFFVMPSIKVGKSIEGFGISFLEAAKYGTPSIGGIEGGSSDIIINGKTGLLCDGNSHEEIYKNLILIMKNNNYKVFGANAKDFAKKFSWEIQIKKYITLIKKN
ncbi:MAG: glycosyl transferase [Candidatus Pelagibacter sp.]|nr:glycosyl transferase [Candidatus Pelagibacter sp.]|tara:strand:- start:7337 stop:8437 length:1101 start_codon:yes stop_codon:yes gene_type:complete